MRVSRVRGLGIGERVAERASAEARVGAEHEQRTDAVVGALPVRFVDRRRQDPVGVVQAVGEDQAARREPDHDGEDRIGPQTLDRARRQLGRALRRVAGHRHLGGGDGQLHRAVELAGLDALAQPGGALRGRATGAQAPATHEDHVGLDVRGQDGICVRTGGERAFDDRYGLGRVAHADHRRERPCRIEPRERVPRRLDALPQMLDRRLAVER